MNMIIQGFICNSFKIVQNITKYYESRGYSVEWRYYSDIGYSIDVFNFSNN